MLSARASSFSITGAYAPSRRSQSGTVWSPSPFGEVSPAKNGPLPSVAAAVAPEDRRISLKKPRRLGVASPCDTTAMGVSMPNGDCGFPPRLAGEAMKAVLSAVFTGVCPGDAQGRPGGGTPAPPGVAAAHALAKGVASEASDNGRGKLRLSGAWGHCCRRQVVVATLLGVCRSLLATCGAKAGQACMGPAGGEACAKEPGGELPVGDGQNIGDGKLPKPVRFSPGRAGRASLRRGAYGHCCVRHCVECS